MVKGMDQGGQVRGGRGKTQRRAPEIAGEKWQAMAVKRTLGKKKGPKPKREGDL